MVVLPNKQGNYLRAALLQMRPKILLRFGQYGLRVDGKLAQ